MYRLYAHDGLDKEVHERNGDDEHSDDVEENAGLDHLRDRDVTGRIGDGVRRRRDRQHECQRRTEGHDNADRDGAEAQGNCRSDGDRAHEVGNCGVGGELRQQEGSHCEQSEEHVLGRMTAQGVGQGLSDPLRQTGGEHHAADGQTAAEAFQLRVISPFLMSVGMRNISRPPTIAAIASGK